MKWNLDGELLFRQLHLALLPPQLIILSVILEDGKSVVREKKKKKKKRRRKEGENTKSSYRFLRATQLL